MAPNYPQWSPWWHYWYQVIRNGSRDDPAGTKLSAIVPVATLTGTELSAIAHYLQIPLSLKEA